MSLAWTLRRATAADADMLALVGATTFLETYAGYLVGSDIVAHCRLKHAPAVYTRWAEDVRAALWLVEAVEGGAPLGYQVVAAPIDIDCAVPSDLELVRIYSLSRLHGQGAGQAMLEAAIGWARAQGAARLLVSLWHDNHRAMAFYRRAGFEMVGGRTFTVGATTYEDPVLALAL